MSVENHIIKVSFCGRFQKAVKPKRSSIYSTYFSCSYWFTALILVAVIDLQHLF